MNTETGPSRSFTIDNVNPSALFSFPASGGSYNTSGWNAGCGTNGFCGTYSDATSGVQSVEISIRQGAGNYWNGTLVRQRQRGLPDRVARSRQLVVRLPGVELPRGRLLHRPYPREGQRE